MKYHQPQTCNCAGCTNDSEKWGRPVVIWKPKVGEKIRLKSFSFYGIHNLSAWTHLEVTEINGNVVTCKTTTDPEEKIVSIDLKYVETPIYWKEQYKITAPNKEGAMKIREWLASRGGVAIWGSMDLSSAGRNMFTPGDKLEKPHWSMELVEVVTDPERLDIGYEVVSYGKPDRKEKHLWRYDRGEKLYYRRFSLETSA